MNNVVGELCLPQEDPGGKQHPLNRTREQGRDALEGEDMSSTSFTDQLFMSPQSFDRTLSGSLRNISEEHKEFLYKCLSKPRRNFTDFRPHTEVKIINSRLLVGTFYKQSCLIWVVELDRKSAELGFIHIICKSNTLNEDQQQEDPPFHLVENVVPNCQLHDLNNIDSNCQREKWLLLFHERKENSLLQERKENSLLQERKENLLQERKENSLLQERKKISLLQERKEISLLQERKENSLLQERKGNRGAIAGVFKDDTLIKKFYVEMPIYKKKKENTIHYEQLLIRQIDTYLENKSQEPHNGTQKGGRMEILIYIPKSPCFKRETETIVPCFFLLLENADRWKAEYNFHTHVGFTDYFGPLSVQVLDKVQKSEILRINSVFYPYTEKSENVSVNLNWKKIQKKIKEMKKEKKFQKIRNLSTDFQNCQDKLRDLAQRELELNQHLKCGELIITSSEFDSTVKDLICKELCKIWAEEVENKRLELIKEKFKTDWNKKFVESFLKHQNFSPRDDFLQFCLIEKQHLTTNSFQSDCHSLDDKNLCSRKDCETVNGDQTGHL